MRLALAIIGVILAAGCGSAHTSSRQALAQPVEFDDAVVGNGVGHFSYSGHWEHVRNREDGRSLGTSSRSWHAGDSAIFVYHGSTLRLYGVTGPNGGDATVAIDGQYYGDAHFYSPQIVRHTVVFASPPLSEGPHTFGLVVTRAPGYPHRLYVNVDGAQVLHSQ